MHIIKFGEMEGAHKNIVEKPLKKEPHGKIKKEKRG